MRRAVSILLMALMLFAIVVLVLNLQEKDYYDGGSETPPPPGSNVGPEDNLFQRIVPREIAHPCATCGDCTHPVEVLENRRVMTLVDHDGWYKLFWAADDLYYYEDPAFLAAGLLNSTAGAAGGTWRIRARVGPPTHARAPPHDCGEIPREIALDYALFTSEPSIAEVVRDAGPHFKVFESCAWFARSYDRKHLPPVLHFGWRLAAPPSAPSERCACAGP